jgi:hypothetical protein
MRQPVGSVYVMIVLSPTVSDELVVITPVTGSMTAIEGSLLVQEPPAEESARETGMPVQMLAIPSIGAGSGFMTTVSVAGGQPATEYDMIVVPAEIPTSEAS